MPAHHQSEDDRLLADLGYKQELVRTLGAFSAFATGFAFISILTGMFLLFGFVYGSGGPASIWSWVIALAGQMLFALVFAELAARYPLTGSVYNWTKQVTRGPGVSWMAGISMTFALIFGTASVALTAQIILPSVSSIFWIYGDGTGPRDASINGVILGAIMLAATTTVSLMGAKVRSFVNNVGVSIELVAVVALIFGFLINAKRGPSIVFETNGTGANYSSGYLGAIMLCLLLGIFVMYGFDTAGSVGEETINPRKTSPRAIIRALLASGIFGALLILTAIMAVSDTASEEISTGGLAFVTKDVLGDGLGDLVLIAVFVAVFVCGLANQTGAVNMLFAMARDNALPMSSGLSRVAERRQTPVLPPIIVAVLALAILLYNIGQPAIFLVVSSTAAIFAMIAYFLIVSSVATARLRGEWREGTPGYFKLGAWGTPVSLAAMVWAGVVIVNLAWPRRDIFNPGEPHWYLQWGGVLLPVLVLSISYLVYRFSQKNKIGVLPEHAAKDPVAVDSPLA